MNEAKMIPCDHVIAKLWEYVDGALTEEHAARIRAHLEVCGHCFPQYDFQRAYKEFIRRTGEQPLPPGVRRKVFEAILAEEASEPAADGPAPTRRDRFRAVFGRMFGGGSEPE